MKKVYVQLIIISLLTLLNISKTFAQNVGIGTDTPNASALLHIDLGTNLTKGFLVTGPSNSSGSTFPSLGKGSRLMFYPGKSAFRAGYANTTQWDDVNVGRSSTAMGANTIASADYSTAIGLETTASGLYSTAMGYKTIASGFYSTAMGRETTASGDYSVAMGLFTIASSYSTAMGYSTTASGYCSTAMGRETTASGYYSVAMGYKVSTNNYDGAFFFGDSDPNNKGVRTIGANDQFAARFNGGYYFITSNSGNDIGVQALPGQNSWSVISDVNRKENFLPVDGESFLDKISTLNLTTWNYKGQNKESFRHYGPMAQDFNAAFGKDDLGTIGCDTLINQQDFLGVNLIAIQALEKRTALIKAEGERQKAESEKIKNEMAEVLELKKENESLKQAVAQLQQQFKILASKQNVTETVVAK